MNIPIIFTKQPTKTIAASLTILSNCLLIAAKILVAGYYGSVSILSEAIHSGIDLLSALITFIAIRLSARPADESHPFGYKKVENISALLEGILLFAASVIIMKEAVLKIIFPDEAENTYLALIIMSISSIVNALLSAYLAKIASRENSAALAADASHLKADAYTSAGVAIGILLMNTTGMSFFDPLIAISVSLIITREAWYLCRTALIPLLDAGLPSNDRLKIDEVMERFQGKIINYHDVKTRIAGRETYINLHVTLDKNLTVQEAHALGEFIESALESAIQNARVSIHVDPF